MLSNTNKNYSFSEEIKFCKKFTDLYLQSKNTIGERELAVLSLQAKQFPCPPQKGDVFVGRMQESFVCFSPQPIFNKGLGYCFDEDRIQQILNQKELPSSEQEQLVELQDYWLKNNTTNKIRAKYPEDVKTWLKKEDYFNERAIAHPLYRLSGSQLNYGKLLNKGIVGLEEEICHAMKEDSNDLNFCKNLLTLLTIFQDYCNTYLNYIEDCLILENLQKEEQFRLLRLKDCLIHVKYHPARNFFDAIQLTLLWWFFSNSNNLERMDTYLSTFYVNDIESGKLTEDEALQLLCSMWEMLGLKGKVYDTRIMLGGKDRKFLKQADHFCKLAISATQKLHNVIPQIGLRIYQGMNPDVYNLAIKAIGEGCTFPMLYNDDVNIQAVQSAFCIPKEIASQYCPYGCGEYVIAHKSIATPSGIINLVKILEAVLNHGKDIATNEVIAPDMGGLENYKTFEDLYAVFEKELRFFVRLTAIQEEIEYKVAGEEAMFLAFSLLYDDCINRHKPLLNGGVQYLGGTLESYGNVNTADSLTAINELIFKKSSFSPKELLSALKANFVGYETLQKLLISCYKYGNDNDIADQMLLRVHNSLCQITRESATYTNLHHYLAVIINNDANTVLGHLTSASPDGRKAGVFLANANNPQGGMDQQGITAMLNSIVKPSVMYHAGSVQNLKLSKKMFSSLMFSKTKALLSAYFLQGGAQIMISVADKSELEDALVHPSNHTNLLVRVGGFSARFIELGRDVQEEIISRTLY